MSQNPPTETTSSAPVPVRSRWTDEEAHDALRLGWPEFRARYPERTFNSWEVKRRRMEKESLPLVAEKYLPDPEVPELRFGEQHIRFGIVSDTHGGSKFEQNTALHDFYDYALGRGARFMVHAGDVTQGSDKMHLGMEMEVHAHGAAAQAQYVTESYPRNGLLTYMIGGNHDASFWKDGGSSIVRQITERRDDMVYLGQDAAHFSVEGIRAYVLHPEGAGSMLALQKFADSLPRGKDVQLLIAGHTHQYGAARQRDTTILRVPCFQGRYAWMGRKGLVPDIGGVLVDLWLTEDGRIDRIAHEVKFYDEATGDWDREASDRVNAPWTDAGA